MHLSVYGYIREFQSSINSDNIPDVIKDVIIEFAKFYFKWQQSKSKEGEYKFNDEDPTRIIRNGPKRRFAFLAMDDVVSLDICKVFEWKLEITKIMNQSSRISKRRIH